MKSKWMFVIALFFVFNTGFGQFVHFHFHFDNNDAATRTKFASLIRILGAKNTALKATNASLNKALKSHKAQLKANYTKNVFDKGDSFLAKLLLSGSLSLVTSKLSGYPKLPYMTKAKREYLDQLTQNKLLLAFLQNVPAGKIKSGKRQEIYRLRGELVKELSRNDKEARKILLFSAAGLVMVNFETFLELSKAMKVIEVLL
ncbi:hypothetical protein ACE939_06870 [Aquimarina sp. W85]|uniref:hypothetical protein n=1 Tax=Aquimarina rhodophyticola TaxID=3342246 RepID=UPI0036735184